MRSEWAAFNCTIKISISATHFTAIGAANRRAFDATICSAVCATLRATNGSSDEAAKSSTFYKPFSSAYFKAVLATLETTHSIAIEAAI
jgi:hypothetical protein